MEGTAGLVFKVTALPLAKKVHSIWNNEKHIIKLAETIDYVRAVLDRDEGKKFQEESENKGYKRLRKAFLDAEDFLDRLRTLKLKKELEAKMLKEEREEIVNKANGKVKRSIGLVGIKLNPYKNKALLFFSKKNQAKSALEVNNKIKKIRKELDAFVKDRDNFGPKEPNKTLAATPMTARASGGYINHSTSIIGRDEDKRRIVDLLLRSSVNDQQKIPVVSIVARGGMGKTTAAQLIYNDESWQKNWQFEHRVWVSDSKKLDLKSLLNHILISINPDQTESCDLQMDHLRQRIVENIKGKRLLLVLDDVENEDSFNWENLKDLLDCGSKDSRILITTRSRKVAIVVGSFDTTHELEGLSKKDSWQLFESIVFARKKNERLEKIGNAILEKCCGVPLAIKVVGKLLCDQDNESKWEYFRNNSLMNNIDGENQIMDILKLSYTELDTTQKQCFSLCALFPKNYRISKRTLSNIWMANVHFKTVKGETVEYACDKSFRILYNRCFLEVEMNQIHHNDTHLVTLDGWDGISYFKLHDLMHDMAKEVVGDEILVVDSSKVDIEEDVRHVTLSCKTSAFDPKGRRVRSLLLDKWNNLDIDNFVLKCPVLRFLDVRHGKIEKLTDSIGKLVHLRYLGLSSNGFQTLPPTIGELINLKKLNLKRCTQLTHLPSRMGALACLEVLDLSYCDKLEELPKGLGKLMKLKKLLLQRCEGLTHFRLGMGALTSLEVLDIRYCSKLKDLPSGIGKLMNLKKLLFEGCQGLVRMPSGIGTLLVVCEPSKFIVDVDSEELNHIAQLEELGSVSDLPAELVIDVRGENTACKQGGDGNEAFPFLLNKPSLRKLEIQWPCKQDLSKQMKKKVSRKQKEVLGKLQPPTSLEELTLREYYGSTFPRWMPRGGFASVMPNLVSLCIWGCQGFKHFPPLSRLDRLRYFHLHSLTSLNYMVEEATCCLPQLESLELLDLPKFRGWSNFAGSVDVPSLRSLVIRGCHSLRVGPFISVFNAPSGLSMRIEDTVWPQ